MNNIERPDIPVYPYEIYEQEKIFNLKGVTQTHCTVIWTIADSKGKLLYEHKRRDFIHRSDDGSCILKPLQF